MRHGWAVLEGLAYKSALSLLLWARMCQVATPAALLAEVHYVIPFLEFFFPFVFFFFLR